MIPHSTARLRPWALCALLAWGASTGNAQTRTVEFASQSSGPQTTIAFDGVTATGSAPIAQFAILGLGVQGGYRDYTIDRDEYVDFHFTGPAGVTDVVYSLSRAQNLDNDAAIGERVLTVYRPDGTLIGTYAHELHGDFDLSAETGGEPIGWFRLTGGDTVWLHYLTFRQLVQLISAADTLASMRPQMESLRRVFAHQASLLNPGLGQDCTSFGERNICVGVGGKRTAVRGEGGESSAGLLTVAYKVGPRWRIGGLLEQRLGTLRLPGLRVGNARPDVGVFGVWQENENGEGLRLRVAARHGRNQATVSREAVGTAQAGSGVTDLKAWGAQVTLSQGFRAAPSTLISPYLALRHIRIQRDGYTENGGISQPLTYGRLSQTASQLLLGSHLSWDLSPSLAATAMVGVERDMSVKFSAFTASGVQGLQAQPFSDGARRTRPVASVGLTYRMQPTVQLAGQLTYRKEALSPTASTTGMVTLSAGF